MKSAVTILVLLAGAIALPGQNVAIHTHPEDPWAPMYFRVFAPDDAQYVPFWVLRPLSCWPSDFVVNNVMDMAPGKPPFSLRAYACPLLLTGMSVYANESDSASGRAPLYSQLAGKYSVQLILVPAADVDPNKPMTVKQLLDLPSKLMGVAASYVEKLFPSPGPNGGGAKLPGLEITANGLMFDGRKFEFHVKGVTPPENPARMWFADYRFVLTEP
jgi:hypothetical protein